MLRKAMNFFHLLDIQPSTPILPEAANTSIDSGNTLSAQADANKTFIPAVLERGEYSILDYKGYLLIAHITLPDVKRLAPKIAQERNQCVRILKHAG
jgi:hypothetical protein